MKAGNNSPKQKYGGNAKTERQPQAKAKIFGYLKILCAMTQIPFSREGYSA